MNNDLYELKDKLRNAPDPVTFIKTAWEDSTKNHSAILYITGTIDALYYARRITQQEYTELYQMIGL